MKLVSDDIHIEKSGIQQEQTFGIHDMGMILDILRSKLYADPIGAICREITCNARDAHREVGKGNEPIKVVLPTHLDANFRVIDRGPGISPKRMADVFIKFAASTKRDTNEQTGGFGLGAKTPFAYSDQFNIITVVDGMKRSYSAFIDPTKVGKLVLMHEVATDEPNGTEIVVPVEPRHFKEFAEKTEAATRWWDVLPEVIGDYRTLRPKEAEIIMKGDDWKIYKRENGHYDRHEPHILIDGIAYKFDTSIREGVEYDEDAYDPTKKQKKTLTILFNGYKQLIVNFPNGQLSLSANRENVHWDDRTKKVVRKRLFEIVDEIRSRLQSEIDTETDYVSAVEKARALTKAFDVHNGTAGFFVWKGTPVVNGIDRSISYSSGTFSTYGVRTRDANGLIAEDAKIDKGKGHGWQFGWDNMIVVNDIGIQHLSPKRAIQILNMLPRSYTSLTLVNDKVLEAKEVQPFRQFIPFINLSEVVGKKDRKGQVVRKSRRLIFKKSGYGQFNISSVEDFENTTGAKVYVMLTRGYDNKLSPSVDGLGYDTASVLDFISTKFKATIFGFDKAQYDADPEGYEEFTEEAVHIKDFIDSVAMKNIDVKATKAAALGWDRYSGSRGEYLDSNVKNMLTQLRSHIDDKTLVASFNEFIDTYTRLHKLYEEWRHVERLASYARADEVKKVTKADPAFDDLRRLFTSFQDNFPLLKFYWKDPSHAPDGLVKSLAEYINLKQASAKK